MNHIRPITALKAWARPACAAVLVVTMIWLVAHGSVAPLHASSHEDGGSHDCALCLFAKGQMLAADVPPAAECAAQPLLATALTAFIRPISSIDLRLAPSRAPPVSSRTSLV